MSASAAFILEELKDAYNQRPPCTDYSTVNTDCETSIDSFESLLSSKNGGSTIGTFETQATSGTKETIKVTNVSRGNVSIPVHELLIEARCDVENKVNVHDREALGITEDIGPVGPQPVEQGGTFQNVKEMIANALGCGCIAVDLGTTPVSDEEIIAAVEQQYETYGENKEFR